ncbi:MAG: D-glycero-alpha-D-manno-heptose-7-phosphate kinase [Lysobacterales bacterium]|jgi:D-glycero-alpha-D-manno-heptose-7-phosphate kinase
MLYFTGFSRFASEIAEHQIKNIPKKRADLHAMQQMTDHALGLLKNNDLRSFGKLLNESWQIKRQLSSKVTTPDIDRMYETAMKNGALGGKLLGAGGGGFMMLFAEPSKQKLIKEKLKKFLYVPIKFEATGSQIIFYQPNGEYE